MLNWGHQRWQGQTGAELFEKLCADLLRSLGFKAVDWRKGHPDEGWDIEAEYDVPYPTGIRTELWYIQCKRYALGRGVPPTKIDTKGVEMRIQKPACLLLITNSFFLPKAKDWAKSTVGYRVELWEGEKLQQLIRQYGPLVEKYFPEIAKTYSDLLTQMTHRLRSSFQSVMSGVSYLKHLAGNEKSISDEFKGHINIIEDLILLITREIERFYFFSLLMETDVIYDFSKTFVDEVIRESARKFRWLAETRDIDIRFSSFPRVRIEADRHRLEMAIDELIHNAITYSFWNHYVEICITQDDLNKCIQIEVSNFGLGISEQEKDRIFQRNYRGEAVTDPRRFIPGSGIGLAICKAIVEAHRGTISVESQARPSPSRKLDGCMTRFAVTLPVRT